MPPLTASPALSSRMPKVVDVVRISHIGEMVIHGTPGDSDVWQAEAVASRQVGIDHLGHFS
jgi:hypothetical protein